MFLRTIVISLCIALLSACGTSTSSVQRQGYYTVKKGDTLYSIGRRFNQTPATLARWNNLPSVSQIDVGQTLRISSPAGTTTSTSTAKTSSSSSSAKTASTTTSSSAAKESQSRAVAAANAEKINWMWPTSGARKSSADKNKKGVDIVGKEGQSIVASADGSVIYSGNGVRGYGDMVIIKHSNAWISVYAHNKTVVVKEGQKIKRGQKIAEMGNTDSSAVKLYFELRRNGESVSPVAFLPN